MTSYLVSMVGASPDVRCAVGAALQVYAEAVTRKAFLSARRNDECAHIGTQMARFAFLSAQDCRFGAHLGTLSCVTWRFAGEGSLIIADYSV